MPKAGTPTPKRCLDWKSPRGSDEVRGGRDVPLSEEELRLLEQMERALVAEDPKFVSTIRGTAGQRAARRRAYVALGFLVVGMAVLVAGAALGQVLVGVLGFVVMLGAAYVGLVSWRGQEVPAPQTQRVPGPEQAFGLDVIQGGKAPRRAPRRARRTRPVGGSSSGGFMERLEERWRRRRESGGF